MARSDRVRWDERYADPHRQLKDDPSPVLARHTPPVVPGSRALELACGLGHNALWLAQQGYRVDAVDISGEALRRAQVAMRARHITGVNFIQADLDCFPLPVARYDLALVFRFLDRQLFPALRGTLRPGGVVVYQTLNIGHLDRAPDTRLEHMLQYGEISGLFPGWTVLEEEEGRYMSTFVGRKPSSGDA